MREEVFAWIRDRILPAEPGVRRWLRRARLNSCEEDDLIQEAYCRLANLDAVGHIRSAHAYFMTTVKNILWERIRRERVVKFTDVADFNALNIYDTGPGPDRIVESAQYLATVLSVVDGLPERCRQVFRLRRLEGLSQRETATRMKISENIVEKEIIFGLKAIREAMARYESDNFGDDGVKVSNGGEARDQQGN